MRYTARSVQTVTLSGDHVDDRYPGLVLRVTAQGTRSWRLRQPDGGWQTIAYASPPARRHNGISVLPLAEVLDLYYAARPGGRRATQAQRLDAKIQALERELEAARAAAGYGLSMAELAERYLDRYSARHHSPRYHREVRRQLESYVLPVWAERAAASIRGGDVAELLDDVAHHRGTTQSRRLHSCLSRLFKWARGKRLVSCDPCAGIERIGREQRREHVLDDDELVAVLRALEARRYPDPKNPRRSMRISPIIADALLMAAWTLQRRQEVATMTWSAVKERPWWQLSGQETKPGRAHRVYLARPALAVLERREPARFAGPYVFRGGRGRSPHVHPDTLSHAFAKIRAGLMSAGAVRRHYREHDLRRTGRTGLSRLGVAPQVGDRVLNHAVTGVRAHYDLYQWDAEVEAALTSWSDQLEILLGRRPRRRENAG